MAKLDLKFFSRIPHEMTDKSVEDFIPPIEALVEINGHRYKITDVVIEQTRDIETARIVHIELLKTAMSERKIPTEISFSISN